MATTVKYTGHIISCRDNDSGDHFQVEVLINDTLPADKFDEIAFSAAAKDHRVDLSGNTFSYEYVQKSGRTLTKTVTREWKGNISESANKLLNEFQIG